MSYVQCSGLHLNGFICTPDTHVGKIYSMIQISDSNHLFLWLVCQHAELRPIKEVTSKKGNVSIQSFNFSIQPSPYIPTYGLYNQEKLKRSYSQLSVTCGATTSSPVWLNKKKKQTEKLGQLSIFFCGEVHTVTYSSTSLYFSSSTLILLISPKSVTLGYPFLLSLFGHIILICLSLTFYTPCPILPSTQTNH